MYRELGIILAIMCVAASSSTIIPTVEVLQGPSSRTILLGADGSSLDSTAPGGTVVTNSHGTGLVAAGLAVLPLGPQLVVNGPAGSIATSHTLGGPAVVPAIAAAAAAPAAAFQSSITDEGDYVSDAAGALYDDGSYRGEH